ncbi:MAG: pilus assembly protein [Chloroflexi bacterium]|nr:pilus assembly protein [Chloroflexota bacterium]
MRIDLARRIVERVAWQRGQSLVEAAITFPLLLMTALGLVQFALLVHAQSVVTGAVQDGARVAASEDRSLADGTAHTRLLLATGLGRSVDDVSVSGTDGIDVVTVEARGRLRLVMPWVADTTLPLAARSTMSKERFRAGPNH